MEDHNHKLIMWHKYCTSTWGKHLMHLYINNGQICNIKFKQVKNSTLFQNFKISVQNLHPSTHSKCVNTKMNWSGAGLWGRNHFRPLNHQVNLQS